MVAAALEVGNQSPLPLIDLAKILVVASPGWESVTSPFDRLKRERFSLQSLRFLGIFD